MRRKPLDLQRLTTWRTRPSGPDWDATKHAGALRCFLGVDANENTVEGATEASPSSLIRCS